MKSLKTGNLLGQPGQASVVLWYNEKVYRFPLAHLVWRAYVGSVYPGEKVYPVDGDPTNVALDNLEVRVAPPAGPGRPRRLSEDQEADLVRRVDAGLSMKVAAGVFDIDEIELQDVLRRHRRLDISPDAWDPYAVNEDLAL